MNWHVHSSLCPTLFPPQRHTLASYSPPVFLHTHQGSSFEGALLVEVLRSRSVTLSAARKQVTFKSASNYQRWKMALPHYLIRKHEKWTVCGRYTTMFMATVR